MNKKIIIGSLGTIIISLLILSSATAVEITRTEKITDMEDK